MFCPECSCTDTVRCFRTTSHEDSTVDRRRRCLACGCVFSTTENVKKETIVTNQKKRNKEREKRRSEIEQRQKLRLHKSNYEAAKKEFEEAES